MSVIGLKLLALAIIPVIHNGTAIHQRLCRLVALSDTLRRRASLVANGAKADIAFVASRHQVYGYTA